MSEPRADLDESQRQITLLALARLKRERPGWAYAIGEIEEKLGGQLKWPPYEPHGLDTQSQVFFYEQEFYPLSNFSAFSVKWRGVRFDTSEAAYHYEKFCGPGMGKAEVALQIEAACSAHEALKIAQHYKARRRSDWDEVKVDKMRAILRAKLEQHEYVRRKLLETGDRELIENSWRDDFWGWGPDCEGQNMLGKLWMELRAELRKEKSLKDEDLPDAGGS